MFDIGWQELLLIGVVALIIIGPKDMPIAMRTAARMFSKVRGLSREFQNTVSEVMREAELDELRRKVQQAGRLNVKDELTAMVDPTGRMREELRSLDELDDEEGLHSPKERPSTVASPVAAADAQPSQSPSPPPAAKSPTSDAGSAADPTERKE